MTIFAMLQRRHVVGGESASGTIVSTVGPTITASRNNLPSPTGPWDTWTLSAAAPAARNLLPNSINQGATQSALPTGWAFFLDAPYTTTVTGSGITAARGEPYVDWQTSGNVTTLDQDSILLLSPGRANAATNGIPASPNTTYTLSFRCYISAGSTTNVFLYLYLLWCFDVNNVLIGGAIIESPLTITTTDTAFSHTFTTPAGTVTMQPALCVQANSGVVLVTLRTSAVQIEAGSVATAFQRTPRSNFYPAKNAAVDPNVSGATKTQYGFNTVFWSEGTNYWGWNTATSLWQFTGTAPASVINVESPAGTTITTVGPTINASPTPGSVGSGNLIAITPAGAISVNGTTIGGANVVELYYDANHTAWQENNTGQWWGPITAASSGAGPAPDPRPPTLVNVTLSNSTFVGNSPSGTVVGAIAAVMSSGSFTGTFSLSGTNASSFQIVGSNLQTNGVVPNGGYSVIITATQAGLPGSPLPVTFPITGATASVGLFGMVNADGSWTTTRAAEYEAAITSPLADPPTLMGQYIGGFSETFASMAVNEGPFVISQWNSAVAATNIKNAFPCLGLLLANAPFVSSAQSNQDYLDVANGLHDAQYNALFTLYKNNGFTKIYIRIAWEYQFSAGYPWLANYGLTNWLAAWRRVAELAHTFSGMTIKTVWNPSEDFSGATYTPAQSYPSGVGAHGDYVDYIGLDTYAGNGWDPLNTASNSFAVQNACTFAVAQNKPIIFAEVGGNLGGGGATIQTFCTNFWTAVQNAPGVKLGGFVIWEENYGDNTGILTTAQGPAAFNTLIGHLLTLPGG